jgi:hypothetical protein
MSLMVFDEVWSARLLNESLPAFSVSAIIGRGVAADGRRKASSCKLQVLL